MWKPFENASFEMVFGRGKNRQREIFLWMPFSIYLKAKLKCTAVHLLYYWKLSSNWKNNHKWFVVQLPQKWSPVIWMCLNTQIIKIQNIFSFVKYESAEKNNWSCRLPERSIEMKQTHFTKYTSNIICDNPLLTDLDYLWLNALSEKVRLDKNLIEHSRGRIDLMWVMYFSCNLTNHTKIKNY